MQIIHHLIHKAEPTVPVACAERYADAVKYVRTVLKGHGVISLFLAMDRPCPYCAALAHPGIIPAISGQIELPADHPTFG